MATADELFRMARSTDSAEDSNRFLISEDLRSVTIPEGQEILGSYHDDSVRRVWFDMPAACDGTDLTDFSISVVYVNAMEESNRYIVTDSTSADGVISFSWLVGRSAFAASGEVRASVCLRKYADDGVTVEKEFNSTIFKMTVLEALEAGAQSIAPYSDAVNALVSGWSSQINASVAQAGAAADAATEAATSANTAADAATEAAGRADDAATGASQAAVAATSAAAGATSASASATGAASLAGEAANRATSAAVAAGAAADTATEAAGNANDAATAASRAAGEASSAAAEAMSAASSASSAASQAITAKDAATDAAGSANSAAAAAATATDAANDAATAASAAADAANEKAQAIDDASAAARAAASTAIDAAASATQAASSAESAASDMEEATEAAQAATQAANEAARRASEAADEAGVTEGQVREIVESYGFVDSETVGAMGGVAQLDEDGKVPLSQLPDMSSGWEFATRAEVRARLRGLSPDEPASYYDSITDDQIATSQSVRDVWFGAQVEDTALPVPAELIATEDEVRDRFING